MSRPFAWLLGLFVVFGGVISCGTKTALLKSENTSFLESEVKLDKCFDGTKLISHVPWKDQKFIELGTVIHHKAVTSKEDNYLEVAIVPYIKREGIKYPIIFKQNNYYFTCNKNNKENHFPLIEAEWENYPTIGIETSKKVDESFRNVLASGWKDIPTQKSPKIEKKEIRSHSTLKMKDLLEQILIHQKVEEMDSRVTAWNRELELLEKEQKIAKVDYLTDPNAIVPGSKAAPSAPPVAESPKEPQGAQTDDEAATEESSSTEDVPEPPPASTAKIEVRIKLPKDFVKLFGSAEKLKKQMKLENCGKDSEITPHANGTFYTACSQKPTSLNITGFQRIRGTKEKENLVIIKPNSRDIFSSSVSLNTQTTIAYFGKNNQQECLFESNGQKVYFHYKCIGKQLFFPNSTVRRCGFQGNLSLKNIGNSLRLEKTECYIDLKSPFKLSESPTGECRLQKKKKTLRCKLSDISSNEKTFTLKWGKGWEDTKIHVDLNEKSHTISADEIRPIWPFKEEDWLSPTVASGSGQPSCDIKTPKYAIDGKVTYKVGNHTQSFELDGAQLPTLEKWKGHKLPTHISFDVKQQPQDGKTARNYEQATEVSWQLSREPNWSLKKLEVGKVEVRASTVQDPNKLLEGSYRLMQYDTMAACRESKDGSALGYYPEKQTLNAKPCAYFGLYDEGEGKRASRCTQISEDMLSFEPSSCGKKRRVVVISTGNGLDSHGRSIENALLKVFQEKHRTPFTVVTINTGRQLSSDLLTCEEMNELEKDEVREFVNEKLISKIIFGARDLRALQDLKKVNDVFQKNLQSVFYIVADSKVLDNVDDTTDLATTNAWRNRTPPVQLTVFTTKSCEVWKKHTKATCYLLSKDNIEPRLREFLQ